MNFVITPQPIKGQQRIVAQIKPIRIKVKLTRFTFRGTLAELDSYSAHLVSETNRYAQRNDFPSVLDIDKELQAVDKQLCHQRHLQAARLRSLNTVSPFIF